MDALEREFGRRWDVEKLVGEASQLDEDNSHFDDFLFEVKPEKFAACAVEVVESNAEKASLRALFWFLSEAAKEAFFELNSPTDGVPASWFFDFAIAAARRMNSFTPHLSHADPGVRIQCTRLVFEWSRTLAFETRWGSKSARVIEMRRRCADEFADARYRLFEGLRDETLDVARFAALALGRIGAEPTAALKARLVELSQLEGFVHSELRTAARDTLERLFASDE